MAGPTFGEAFDIDQAATRYVAEVMASNWVLRKREPDIFVDYEIEQRTAGEPTGKTALIQMKGKRGPLEESEVSHPFTTKQLRYYLESRQPVFVVVVDTKQRRAYYLFIQEWLKPFLGELKSQKTLSVRVPRTNELENFPRFLSDFQRALDYMHDCFPGRPEAAVANIERKLEELDSRFKVKVTATANSQHISLSPLHPGINVSLNVRGVTPEKFSAASNALDWGRPFRVEGIELSAKGSRLFEEMCKTGKGTLSLEPARSLACRFVITARRKQKTLQLILTAKLTAGRKGAAVITEAPGCPIAMELNIFWTEQGKGISGKLEVSLRAEEWIGREVQSAPYRSQLVAITKAISEGAEVSLRVSSEDGRLDIEVPRPQKPLELLKTNAWWFLLIGDASLAAERYSLRPTIPAPNAITEGVISDMNFAHDTTLSDTIKRPYFNIYHKDLSEHGHALVQKMKAVGPLVGNFRGSFPCMIEVFDAKLPIGHLEVADTRCRLSLLERIPDGFHIGFRVEKVPAGNFGMVIRRSASGEDVSGLESFYFDPEPAKA